VLLIEQFAALALGLASRAYVLERGALAYSGTAQELREQPWILHGAYLSAGLESGVSAMRRERFDDDIRRFNAEDAAAFDEYLSQTMKMRNRAPEYVGIAGMRDH
jgi:hypothetical protein